MIEKSELKKLHIVPVNKHVVVVAQEIVTGGGIILPERANKLEANTCMLEVLLVAEDCEQVKAGDYVQIRSNAFADGFDFLEDKYIMFKEEEVGVVYRRKDK